MHICLFDIDGTLVNTGGAGKAALDEALVEVFGVAQASGVSTVGRTDRGIAIDMFTEYGTEHTEESWQRFLDGYLLRLSNNLPQRDGRVLPGVEALLDLLATREDVAVGLLTGNVEEGARRKLEFFGIAERFAFGGFGDLHPSRNSVAAEALQQAERFVGQPADPQRVWVIGDTPLDVQCARAIGARAIGVSSGLVAADELAASDPDLMLSDLSDPGPLLAMMDGAI